MILPFQSTDCQVAEEGGSRRSHLSNVERRICQLSPLSVQDLSICLGWWVSWVYIQIMNQLMAYADNRWFCGVRHCFEIDTNASESLNLQSSGFKLWWHVDCATAQVIAGLAAGSILIRLWIFLSFSFFFLFFSFFFFDFLTACSKGRVSDGIRKSIRHCTEAQNSGRNATSIIM